MHRSCSRLCILGNRNSCIVIGHCLPGVTNNNAQVPISRIHDLNHKSCIRSIYTKPNNTLLCIHTKSNYPPVIVRNLAESINKTPSDISTDEDLFNRAVPAIQKALQCVQLPTEIQTFNSSKCTGNTQNWKRQRNVTWDSCPYSKNVATNIGRTFICLVNNCQKIPFDIKNLTKTP